ncbi:uncharacterized protein LOC108104638 [Drosophila eugracilis]|uniref:uncharacterized protein LOC108104638 n=1 Tax=Drosophila eugracilis TaxID=29029 RepID=UPI0007E7F02C|nr:uncharacterized protein LOC108104638 [Drosophila eugracilis]
MADVEEEEAPPEDGQIEGQEGEEDLEVEGESDEEVGEEEAESENEEDPFELLNESEPEDEEQKAMYKEYLEVIKDIDAQNLVIRDLKEMATRLMNKKCKTFKDKQEYKQLRACQEQQDIHLKTLINRAIQLQNFGSRRRYRGLEMEVTEDETSFFTGLQPSFSSGCPASSGDESCQACCFSTSESDSDSDGGYCCP